MNYAIALGSLALFALGFRLARIVPITADAVKHAHSAFALLGDATKSEEEKERAARAASMHLVGRFLTIALRTATALIAPALVVFLAAQSGAAGRDDILGAFLSPWLVACALALFAADYWFHR